MSKKVKVVGGMSEWSGLLKDLFRQIDDGSVSQKQLQLFLERRSCFINPILDWQDFYRNVFGMKVSFYGLRIPEYIDDFNRLVVMAKGMTPQMIYDKYVELFLYPKWTGRSLDEIIKPFNTIRDTRDRSYAVWFRDRQEADVELKNVSADELKERNISGITLEERLIFGLKFFKETGEHLDIKNVTLCSGSRRDDGVVPVVRWYGRGLIVYWHHPGSPAGDCRTREAVL